MAITDESIKAQVIIGAVTAAGPGASDTDIVAAARKIINFLSSGSAILAEFDRVDKRDETTEKVKTFRGTITGVDKEVTSERGVVFLKTKPSEWHPDGKENLRTERVDSVDGREMARLAQSLIGHQVTITVGVEVMPNHKKSRVMRGIQDLGVDPAYDADNPDFQVSYGELDTAKLASHGAIKQAA